MTSIEMRDNPLFMRNGFESVGKWGIPLVKKQNLNLSDIRLVACSDTRANDNVDTTFSPDGKWEGVKILKGMGTQHGLPESSHSSSAYIKLDPDGKFKEIRFYDKNHCLYFEIGYNSEKNIDASGKPVLHYHTYEPSFSMTKEGNGGRSKAMKLTKSMKKHFRKYFKGVSL